MIRPRNEKEALLLSITKNCETLNKQIHTKPEETMEFKLTKPRETFLFNPPISIDGSWMIGLTSLEAYSSIFIITEENNLFELLTDTFDEFLFEDFKGKLEEIVIFSDNTTYHLKHEIGGPRIFEEYKKMRLEKLSTDGYSIWINNWNVKIG